MNKVLYSYCPTHKELCMAFIIKRKGTIAVTTEINILRSYFEKVHSTCKLAPIADSDITQEHLDAWEWNLSPIFTLRIAESHPSIVLEDDILSALAAKIHIGYIPPEELHHE